MSASRGAPDYVDAPLHVARVPKTVDWYMHGKIEIDPMITYTLPLKDINKGLDLMHSGESIGSVVIYD